MTTNKPNFTQLVEALEACDTALFCDLKTDEEKSTFFLSGRGYETGVIAQAIQNDVAMAYHRCSEYREEMEALQAECEKLRKDAERYRWLREQHWSSGEMAVLTRPRENARLGAWLPSRDLLDEAIDAAMAGGDQ